MLVIDPARRLSMREIITHKWMKMDGEDEEFNKLIQVLGNLGFMPRHSAVISFKGSSQGPIAIAIFCHNKWIVSDSMYTLTWCDCDNEI